MLNKVSPLTEFQARLAGGKTTLAEVAETCVQHANGNAGRNTYIGFDAVGLVRQAEALETTFPEASTRPPLWGVPISLKDCFDLAGTVTTCGSAFYAQRNSAAAQDSAMVMRLHAAAALITGKTQLHPLAYGITGENPDYGDCTQPRDRTLLTGGSSSGAAASVQEGSALIAIGTDTGGSIRVPAALCGLAGYRASHQLAYAAGPWPAVRQGLWKGAAHLAGSYDTVGILLRDVRDAAPVAEALFGLSRAAGLSNPRIGFVGPEFLAGCEPEIFAALTAWRSAMVRRGAETGEIDTAGWTGAEDVFAGIQAHEAAALHRGHYAQFGDAIRQRLEWGAALTSAELAPLEAQQETIRAEFARLFDGYDFLALPCAPVSRLLVGEDQSAVRPRILQYTAPFSLAGLPVVALPGEMLGAALGTGVQISAAPGKDAELLAYAAALAQALVDEA